MFVSDCNFFLTGDKHIDFTFKNCFFFLFESQTGQRNWSAPFFVVVISLLSGSREGGGSNPAD